jgi:hypothetical protein
MGPRAIAGLRFRRDLKMTSWSPNTLASEPPSTASIG